MREIITKWKSAIPRTVVSIALAFGLFIVTMSKMDLTSSGILANSQEDTPTENQPERAVKIAKSKIITHLQTMKNMSEVDERTKKESLPVLREQSDDVSMPHIGQTEDDISEKFNDRTMSMIFSHFMLTQRTGKTAAQAEEESLRNLRSHSDEVLPKLIEMYEDEVLASERAEEETEYSARGRARWRIVDLLGELSDPNAHDKLLSIIDTPLPSSEESEPIQDAEYRIRLRAIDGLRKINAVQTLEEIYHRNGPLKTPAAVALSELDRAPPGVVQKNIHNEPNADPTDWNTEKKEKPQSTIPPTVASKN